MKKILFRQIKNSIGRFLAIFGIIALGVGFFAGLRITADSIIGSVSSYLDEKEFYDFELLSTLGFTDDDVKSFSELPYVTAAEGSLSCDFIFSEGDGKESVVHAHAILPSINQLDVVSGRMPVAPNECVMDSMCCSPAMIGKELHLTENNPQSTDDMMAYDTYTIVGIANSPSYLSFSRGSTKLGSGSVAGFCYIPLDGFTSDIWTEIYVKTTATGKMYSEEYTASIDEIREDLDSTLVTRADIRYMALCDEANAKIADAEAEVSDGWAQISDARQEIADAKTQLSDAEKELADARKKLDDAQVEYSDGKTKLSEAQKEYDDNLQLYWNSVNEFDAKKLDAEKQLKEAEAIIDANAYQLSLAQSQLAASEKDLLEAESHLPELYDAREQAQSGISMLESLPRIVFLLNPSLNDQLQEAKDGLVFVNDQIAQIENARKEFDSANAQIRAGSNALSAGISEFNSAQKEYKDQIADAESQLTDAKNQLVDGKQKIADAEKELQDAAVQIEDGEREYREGKDKYESSKRDADQQILDAEAEIRKGESDLLDAEAQIADAKEELSKLKKPTTFLLDRSMNIGYASLDNDTSIVTGVSRVFPVFFFLVAALVCITTMTRMVQEQRTHNGTLKALGFTDADIVMQYMVYAGSASLLGSVTGFLIGSRFLPQILWEIYKIMYFVDRTTTFILDWKLFAFCVSLYMLCALGATWLVCHRELREVPAELIRPKAPEIGKRILLERVDWIWSKLSFLHKVSIRNILRYKRRMFMMIIGIGGCTGLLLTGFAIRDSICNIANNQYDEIQLYDATVSFSGHQTDEAQETFICSMPDDVTNTVFLHTDTLDIILDSGAISANAVASSEPLTEYVHLSLDGTPVSWPGENEVVINERLADAESLSIGDTITLRNNDYEELNVTITGIFTNYIYDYIYLNTSTYESQLGYTPDCKTCYLNFGCEYTEEAHHKIGSLVLNQDDVISISMIIDQRTMISSILKNLNYIVYVVLVCAGALAFIVLYNLTNITINERMREIASLKVLGFHSGETASYVYRENRVLVGISAICGIPMGIALSKFVMNQIVIATMFFRWQIANMSYLYSIAITFVFTIIIHLALRPKLERINMAESMKAIE